MRFFCYRWWINQLWTHQLAASHSCWLLTKVMATVKTSNEWEFWSLTWISWLLVRAWNCAMAKFTRSTKQMHSPFWWNPFFNFFYQAADINGSCNKYITGEISVLCFVSTVKVRAFSFKHGIEPDLKRNGLVLQMKSNQFGTSNDVFVSVHGQNGKFVYILRILPNLFENNSRVLFIEILKKCS